MRIPISLAILGVAGLVGAGAFGVWQLRNARPAPSQDVAMARELVGQWRPVGLTCADGVTIAFHSGNLIVNYGGQSEGDVQTVAGLEPNGFIRAYSTQRGSRFYLVEGDTLTIQADGQTTAFERCGAGAPVATPVVASAPDAAPPPLPQQMPGEAPGATTPAPARVADATQAAAAPRARAAAPATEAVTRAETPPPAVTVLAAAPPAPMPEPIAAPPPPPITHPVWLARPSAAEIAIFYPERALVRELPGSARLDCTVRQDGSLACSVQAESPAGYGFGEAALGIAQSFRMAPNLTDGSATEGRQVLVPIFFTQN